MSQTCAQCWQGCQPALRCHPQPLAHTLFPLHHFYYTLFFFQARSPPVPQRQVEWLYLGCRAMVNCGQISRSPRGGGRAEIGIWGIKALPAAGEGRGREWETHTRGHQWVRASPDSLPGTAQSPPSPIRCPRGGAPALLGAPHGTLKASPPHRNHPQHSLRHPWGTSTSPQLCPRSL